MTRLQLNFGILPRLVGLKPFENGALMETTGSNRAFRPHIDPNCRSFDLTLQFGDVCFDSLLAAVFLTLLPTRIAALLLLIQRESPTGTDALFPIRTKHLEAEFAAFASLLIAQLVFLALRIRTLRPAQRYS
ncbi:hypothetical protein F4776DRAFT_670822 [Hypoxylon sp. NC0597]|nr:hypothetical protein F4776DRAFT_670822 [Hypoxylon sp. NC0597]